MRDLYKLLTLLINQCIHTDIHPDQLKLPRLKPLYKVETKHNLGIIDHLHCCLHYLKSLKIFKQLLIYLLNNNLLCINQFEFRPRHSAELAAFFANKILFKKSSKYSYINKL